MNRFARSLLFVHQPIEKQVIGLLEEKMGTLRISQQDFSHQIHHKSIDFIKRPYQHGLLLKELKKLKDLGVKVSFYPLFFVVQSQNNSLFINQQKSTKFQ